MPFFVDGNPTPGELSDAVNYLLSNFTQNTSADPATGQITAPTGIIQGYIYKYIAVKYADSFDGTVNFSNTPTSRLYYGIRNSNDSTESTNPADYLWTAVAGGFGTTKFLYYITTGGRSIQFAVATSVPNTGWVIDPNTSIDLDVISGTNGPANFVVIRITNVSSAPTDAECIAAIGRGPITGDLCTINYNSGISSIVYKYTTGWAIFQKYITGDLIVAATIVAANLNVAQLSAISANMGSITAGSIVGALLQVGNAVRSGTTIGSGSGATLESTGKFALGNTTANMAFDGSTLAINGPLIGTNNIVANAISISYGNSTTSLANNTNFGVTGSFTAGDNLFITASVSGQDYSYNSTSSTTFYIKNGTTVISSVSQPGMVSTLSPTTIPLPCSLATNFIVPSTGTYTFNVSYSQPGSVAFAGTLPAAYIQILGLKR
jgi:hypothetical protein